MSFLLSYFTYPNNNISSSETNQSISKMNLKNADGDLLKDVESAPCQNINCYSENINENNVKSIENTEKVNGEEKQENALFDSNNK